MRVKRRTSQLPWGEEATIFKALKRGRTEVIRSELIALVHKDQPGLSPREVEQIVASVFDAISKRLAEGGRVELRGFGTFTTRSRDGRVGRNPRTGEPVDVQPKRVPYFKPGKEMRHRLNV
jgi:integration host factor subunit beta